MFRYTVIAVGKMKSRHLDALCLDFTKRLGRSGKFEIIELKDSDLEGEGDRILEAIDKRRDAAVYVMAEEGKTRTSAAFARELDLLRGRHAVFVIGGAYGLSPRVKARADQLFALSPLTFTHEIARMLLAEQLYRAVSINSGSKYHHE